MKPIYFFIMVLILSAECSSQWQQINAGTEDKINSICFINNMTGYCVTQYSAQTGYVYKTINGGTNWFYIYSNAFPFKNVYFPNPQNGFIVCPEHILVTTDAGSSWVDKYKPGYEIYDIRFQTSNLIYAVGLKIQEHNTAYLRSYDGGMNWTSQLIYSGSTSRLFSIRFLNNYSGYSCGEYGTVMRMVEGGPSNFLNTGTTNHLYTLSFFNDSTGFVAGANSTLLKTTNNGFNWTFVNTGFNNINFNSINFFDTNIGYIGGSNGFIAKTTNSGVNWVIQNTNTSYNINCITFLNRDTLFAVGDNGLMLRTYNGSISGINKIDETIPLIFNLKQNYPNPFNPTTSIKFDVPFLTDIKMTVFNAAGRVVKILVDQRLSPGQYSIDFDGTELSSGIYFYSLFANGYSLTKKMILIK